jgi:hypothetical protein
VRMGVLVHYVRSFTGGGSNGGRQFSNNRRSIRHIVPLYGASDILITQVLKFQKC